MLWDNWLLLLPRHLLEWWGLPLNKVSLLDLRVGWQVSTSNVAGLSDYIAAGGIAGRQVADKTYYMGLLHTQLGLLQKEIDSLSDELARAEREQQNLLLYEQKAEEKANEIKELQNELSDYNLVKLNLEIGSNSIWDNRSPKHECKRYKGSWIWSVRRTEKNRRIELSRGGAIQREKRSRGSMSSTGREAGRSQATECKFS